MDNRISLDESYMRIAEVFAGRSKAVRKKVGAVCVTMDDQLFLGYNGMPKGAKDDVCEIIQPDGSLVTKHEVLHAESNALLKITKNGGSSSKGGSLYITLSPCKDCAKLIMQSEIKNVFYREQYRDTSGIDLLLDYNVNVQQL